MCLAGRFQGGDVGRSELDGERGDSMRDEQSLCCAPEVKFFGDSKEVVQVTHLYSCSYLHDISLQEK